jgi:hypothetical protein
MARKTMKERKVMIINFFLFVCVICKRASELFLLVMSWSICCKFICCCVAYIFIMPWCMKAICHLFCLRM